MDHLPIDTKINGYTIIEHLDAGGFGLTYLVTDGFQDKFVIKEFFLKDHSKRTTKQTVVPKNLSEKFSKTDYQRTEEQFRKEGFILKDLSHKNIVQVRNIFDKDTTKYNSIYLVLEYIKGCTLKEWLENNDPQLASEHTPLWIKEIGEALAYLHQLTPPVFHLDVKPSNIMIEEGSNRAVLIDFGISKQTVREGIVHETVVGHTPGYSAPEQILGAVAPNAALDVYALGATAFYTITGVLPKIKDLSALEDVNPLLPHQNAIKRALNFEATDRGTITDFLQQWTLDDSADITVPPRGREQPVSLPKSTNLNKIYGVVAMILVGLLAGWWLQLRTPNITDSTLVHSPELHPANGVGDSVAEVQIPITKPISPLNEDNSNQLVTDNSKQNKPLFTAEKKDESVVIDINPVNNNDDTSDDDNEITDNSTKPITKPLPSKKSAAIWRGTIIPDNNVPNYKEQEIELSITEEDRIVSGEAKVIDVDNEQRWMKFSVIGTINPATQTMTIKSGDMIDESGNFVYCTFTLKFSDYSLGKGELSGKFSAGTNAYKKPELKYGGECTGTSTTVTIRRKPI